MSQIPEFKPKTEDGIVYRAGKTFFHYNGWPSVCKGDDGTLFAVASSHRIQHVCPCGKTAMFVSKNEGKTWTPPIIVNDTYLDDRDAGIINMGNGKMLISWFNLPVETYKKDCEEVAGFEWMRKGQVSIIRGIAESWDDLPEEDRAGGSFVRISEDEGVTWGEAIKVPVSTPHGPSLMNDGSLMYMGKEMKNDYLAESRIAAYRSEDCGKTWTLAGVVPFPEDCPVELCHEPHVIQLPNGRLLGAIRVHKPFTVYTSFSDDMGKTWSVAQGIGVDGSPPHLLVHSSGAVICSFARRGEEGDRSQRAVVSYDNGENWQEEYLIREVTFGVDLGYPASVELEDGTILTVYYQSLPDEWNCSVLYTKWKLNK